MPTDLRIGIIGGTGLETRLFEAVETRDVESVTCETPFGPPSGAVTTAVRGETPVAILARHGDGHLLNPAALPSRANVYALKSIGCTHIVSFGATGSLREHIAPGNLVVCDQLIDRTVARDRTFYEQAAVHVEFADPFCPVMRRWLLEAASRLRGVTVHASGTYVCMEGPSFSTRAEANMHRQWGADVVGMTALPEARLAREAEIAYTLVALPTDFDCWRPRNPGSGEDSLLGQVMANLDRAVEASVRLVSAALEDIEALRREPSPAHCALDHAIWSDKSKIDPAEVERLRPLWGRFF
ncbi:MAG: MTAP family purine nucleoside phosphorylase [Planctomycetota bacterium]|jgi:5'-methylthioadenosine phosphorylase